MALCTDSVLPLPSLRLAIVGGALGLEVLSLVDGNLGDSLGRLPLAFENSGLPITVQVTPNTSQIRICGADID